MLWKYKIMRDWGLTFDCVFADWDLVCGCGSVDTDHQFATNQHSIEREAKGRGELRAWLGTGRVAFADNKVDIKVK